MSNKIQKVCTAEYLKPVQITYQGTTYSPITHKAVIDTIGEYLYKNNFIIKKENYLAASNGQRAIGRLAIEAGDSEFAYELSWKNSTDGSMSFGLCSGVHTFICSNGSVYGDISGYKRKHSGEAAGQILFEIENTINQVEETVKLHQERRAIMKEKEITKRTISELCGRLYLDNEIISSNQLKIIKGEMENPSYNYNCDGSVYQFYQFCTDAIPHCPHRTASDPVIAPDTHWQR